MRKILIGLLSIGVTSAFAAPDNAAFQQFDDQYNIGYGVNNVNFSNGAGNQSLQQSQYMAIDVERLFDVGIWMNVNADLVLSQNSLGSQATGTGMGNSGISGYPGMPSSQDPNFGGANAKVGYAFNPLPQSLQITPYALVGRNTNLAMSAITSNGFANVTNDYYYTGGVGARIEYRINQYFFVYADQLASYNWDQSGPTGGVPPQNNMIWVSTLGAKFNIVKDLQVGIAGIYNNYQAEAATPAITSTNNGGNSGAGLTSIYQPTTSYGGLITVGLTY